MILIKYPKLYNYNQLMKKAEHCEQYSLPQCEMTYLWIVTVSTATQEENTNLKGIIYVHIL